MTSNYRLPPALEEEQRFLKRMVRQAEAEVNRKDAKANAQQDLAIARQELKKFNNEMRQAGFNI